MWLCRSNGKQHVSTTPINQVTSCKQRVVTTVQASQLVFEQLDGRVQKHEAFLLVTSSPPHQMSHQTLQQHADMTSVWKRHSGTYSCPFPALSLVPLLSLQGMFLLSACNKFSLFLSRILGGNVKEFWGHKKKYWNSLLFCIHWFESHYRTTLA